MSFVLFYSRLKSSNVSGTFFLTEDIISFYPTWLQHSKILKYRPHIYLIYKSVKTTPLSIYLSSLKREASDVRGFIREGRADKFKDNSCRSSIRAHTGSQRVMILLYLHDFSFIDFSHDITPCTGILFTQRPALSCVGAHMCKIPAVGVHTVHMDVCEWEREREWERKPVLGCVGKYVKGSLGLRDICGSRDSLLGYQFSPSIMRQ